MDTKDNSDNLETGRSLHILLVSDIYLSHVNGVNVSMDILKEGLIRQGHEVKILTLSRDTKTRILQDGEVIAAGSYGGIVSYSNVRQRIGTPRRVISFFDNWPIDVIHTNNEFAGFQMARKLSEIHHAPIVHTFHTNYSYYIRYLFWGRWFGIDKKCLNFVYNRMKKADAIIAPSPHMFENVCSAQDQKPVFMIPTVCNIRLERRKKNPRKTVLFLGRMAEEKNPTEFLTNILREMKKRDNFDVMIVGEGPSLPKMKSMIEQSGMQSRFTITGQVSHEQVPSIYARADIYIQCSVSEAQGLCLEEAAMSGCALLIHKAPDYPSVREGENGYFYETDEEFEEKFNEIIEHTDRYVSEGKKKNPDLFVNEVLKVYQKTRTNCKDCIQYGGNNESISISRTAI